MNDSNIRIGFLTIGQSPRIDVMDDIRPLLVGIEIIEAGALDDFDKDYITSNLSPESGETPLVTRLRDGSQVIISEEKILPLLQDKIYLLEKRNVKAIVILCSGRFPEFKSKTPIIYPDRILEAFVMPILNKDDVLGIIAPLPEQHNYIMNKWSRVTSNIAIEYVSPYTGSIDDYISCCKRLIEKNTKLIVLDCIGYSFSIKELVRSETNLPVISTRSALASYLRELYVL